MFLISDTQATLSTHTGWIANSTPANQAPGIRITTSSRHNRSAPLAWRRMVTAW